MGGTGSYLLASLSLRAWDLPTGGMPELPLPPMAVMTFEGLAIGAILFTVATVLWECRLPKLRHRVGPLDRHLAEGRILLSVRLEDSVSGEWAAGAVATHSENS